MRGIILHIESSVAIDSCFRLSIRGLASEALTGVIRSTQYDESLGVRNGMIIILNDFPKWMSKVSSYLYK